MISRVRAVPSCDQVFLVWDVTAMIPGCAGFAVFRKVDGNPPEPLETWVGFEDETPPPPGTHKPSTTWPVQKTSWTDYLAPITGSVSYGVVPVLLDGNKEVVPPQASNVVWSDPVTLAQGDAAVTAWFNRGTIAAQWLARALGSDEPPAKKLAQIIDTPGDPIRNFLAGEARARLVGYLDAVKTNDKLHLYAALFELNDRELVDLLKVSVVRTFGADRGVD